MWFFKNPSTPLVYCAVWHKKIKNKKTSNLPWLECPFEDWMECIFVTQGGAHLTSQFGSLCCESGSTRIFTSRRFTGALVQFQLLVLSCYSWTSTYSLSIPRNRNTCGPILRTGKTRITRYVSRCLLNSRRTRRSASTLTLKRPSKRVQGFVCLCACECW